MSGDKHIARVDNENASECEANAQLIAAAPDLYEACKFAVRVLDDVRQMCADKGQNGLWDTAQQAINKILAKAEGKQ